jgi:hypothetical protein
MYFQTSKLSKWNWIWLLSMLKSETWLISLPVKAFSKHMKNKVLHGLRKIFQKLSNCFKTNSYQDSMVFTLILVKLFFFKTLSKKTSMTLSMNFRWK